MVTSGRKMLLMAGWSINFRWDTDWGGIFLAKLGPMFTKKSLNLQLITDLSVVKVSSFNLNLLWTWLFLFLLTMLYIIHLTIIPIMVVASPYMIHTHTHTLSNKPHTHTLTNKHRYIHITIYRDFCFHCWNISSMYDTLNGCKVISKYLLIYVICGIDIYTHIIIQHLHNYTMMTSSNGNIFRLTGPLCWEFTGPGEFPAQRPVTRSFDVFIDLRLNKRLNKQPWGWWFETLPLSLWRHCNAPHAV